MAPFPLIFPCRRTAPGSPDPSGYLGGGGGGMPGGGGGIPQFWGLLITRGWYAMPAGTGTEWPLTYMHWM